MMTALEKVAWTEASISLGSLVVVAALYPWLGDAAMGGFGLLGFMALAALFLRRRGSEILVDERDQQIMKQAHGIGIVVCWLTMFMTLLALVMWSIMHGEDAIPVRWLAWLLWTQFALCYALKGLVSIRIYRSQQRAA